MTPADIAPIGLTQVGARHHAHGGNATEQQHRIGLGEPRLDVEEQAGRDHQSGEKGAAARHESERGPIGQQRRADCADQRRHAIEPDGGARFRYADSLGSLHHGGLQPVDADGFLVAHLILKADVDVVARLQHLLGGLGKPRFVAVDRGNVEESRQERNQGHEHQQQHRAHVRRGGKTEQCAKVFRYGGPREALDHVRPVTIPADTRGNSTVRKARPKGR